MNILLTGAMLLFMPTAVAQEKKEKSEAPASYLQIGKVAPDTRGQDVDGKKFKLSDYRGKVVVLLFWRHA